MLLGLRRNGDHLQITPCIPKDWPEYQLNYRFGKTMYHIRVENKPNSGLKTNQVLMDGENLKDENIPLMDDQKTHEILIKLAAHDPVD